MRLAEIHPRRVVAAVSTAAASFNRAMMCTVVVVNVQHVHPHVLCSKVQQSSTRHAVTHLL